MEIRKYNYEILGLKGKKLGEFQSEEKSKKDMMTKAQGVMLGAGVLRANVNVIVRDENNAIVYNVRKEAFVW